MSTYHGSIDQFSSDVDGAFLNVDAHEQQSVAVWGVSTPEAPGVLLQNAQGQMALRAFGSAGGFAIWALSSADRHFTVIHLICGETLVLFMRPAMLPATGHTSASMRATLIESVTRSLRPPACVALAAGSSIS